MTVQELETLLAELEKIDQELKKQEKIKVVIPEVSAKDRETASDMQSQLEKVKEEIAQLEKDLKARKDVPTEGNVTVLPQGSGQNFTPHFVECANGSIVLHNLPEPKRVRQGDVVKDEDFLLSLIHI